MAKFSNNGIGSVFSRFFCFSECFFRQFYNFFPNRFKWTLEDINKKGVKSFLYYPFKQQPRKMGDDRKIELLPYFVII